MSTDIKEGDIVYDVLRGCASVVIATDSYPPTLKIRFQFYDSLCSRGTEYHEYPSYVKLLTPELFLDLVNKYIARNRELVVKFIEELNKNG